MSVKMVERVVDRAFLECVNEIAGAHKALHKLERATCRIAAQRKTVSTGQACLESLAVAKQIVSDLAGHLARYEARLQQLVEGVDRHAPVG